ncbi:kinase-like protein [Exidia glandulosa HHB12029]|uniref:Kinase-like protein n=1 Tax=Exidia glandulosa HHB12029 TaxID=1314781 RepID=A0A165CXN7_EXIGL|nr:kinase-like protein [Exidia glandulosa HHB12029]
MGNCFSGKPIDFDGEPTLFHFSLLRNIGKGAFGKVRVVRHKKTQETYALKYIDKKKCVKMKAVPNIIQERRLLEEIDHAFIVNLRYAFQDDENCFFVIDLMLGGDLRFHLERSGKLPEPAVRFWTAELGSAIAYLHAHRIVHRDLKPDNILLDAAGHAHLTDFNIAVHVPSSGNLTGVAGSMAYMAPEVLARRPYGAAVDWWSLGVCVYELLVGRRPFRGQSNEELRSAISAGVHANLWSGHDEIRADARDAITKFLDKTPANRLGARGADELRRHSWFNQLDWGVLERKQLQSPWVPDPNKANFDATYDLEELLLEDNPLRARERKVQDVNNLSQEMRQLEEQFTSYDFMSMNRRSYYPQNQIVSSVTGASTVSRQASPEPAGAGGSSVPMQDMYTDRGPSTELYRPRSRSRDGRPSGEAFIRRPSGEYQDVPPALRKPSGEEQAAYAQLQLQQQQWQQGYR